MKASIEWLQEYAKIENISLKDLNETLTMTGSKVEEIVSKGGDIKNVVVGKILEIEKHPNADKLVVTKVDVGTEKLQIVTGANNIKVGDIVPIAKDGSELPGGVKIKKGALRGVESNGMMCSVGELGLSLSDYSDQIEHGIMILPSTMEKDLGKDIVDVLNLREDIIEFEITPNRPDCLSIEGLGREVAVSLGEEFKNPRKNIDEMKVEKKQNLEGLTVEIAAPDLCYRYVARAVKNVKIAPSPEWMKRRLIACGMRPINNIVDITNYVMLEMGQPMHAFDINSIEGKHITVRRAKKSEKITTLDEVERILHEENLVIADSKKAVAIAGVMGGLNSEIEDNTQTVVFESAVFKRGSVRITAKEVGLRTEASARYEKGLSPENALRAANRAVELVELLGAGEAVDGVIDVYPGKQKLNKIEFNPERINALLGTDISKEQMLDILGKLDIKLEDNMLIPPYYRMDLEQEADIAEEVLRIYGYDKLGSTLICAETTLGKKNKKQRLEDDLRRLMVDRGYSEVCTYGFINPKDLEKSNIQTKRGIIPIKNPLSEDYTIMRTSVIPSMMQVMAVNNAKKNENACVFEIGRIYIDDEQISKQELPKEEEILSVAMYGENEDFYTLKGIVENVLEVSGVRRYEVSKEDTVATSYHPGRCAKVCVGNDVVAVFGQIHPIVTENYDINKNVYVAEILVDKLVKYGKKETKYTEVPKFPAVERDIAVVVDEEVEAGSIEKVISKKCKKILENIKLFDVYRSEKLGENKKSMAYRLTFRSSEKTLAEEEITKTMQTIMDDLSKELKAELRK